MDKDPFKEYIKQSEPNKRDKGYAWHTAIGLQAVDGLKTSKYLIDTAIKSFQVVRQCDSCDCVYIRSSSTVRVEIVVLLSVSDSMEEVLKMVILRMSVRTGVLVSFAAIVIRNAVVEICW